MSKRSAADCAAFEPPRKKHHADGVYAPSDSGDEFDFDFDDVDDASTVAETLVSEIAAESPATAATTPRAKFPSDLKTLACSWPGCPKTFNRPARLRDHMNSHTNSRPFKCPYDGCGKDYIEDKHLKQHVKAAHTNERNYVCQVPGCNKSFVTGTRLKRHQLVHEGADRFRCQDCGQSFRKRETLTKHVRKEHLHIRAYACPEVGCADSFDSKPALKRHREKSHGDIKYWCGECSPKTAPDGTQHRVGFTTELLLHEHLRKEHQNCIFCDFKSTSRWELDQHVDMHHSGKTVKDRKVHACTHHGCSKKFTKKSNLTAHVRTAHEGFRFVCGQVTLCGDGFKAWSDQQGCGHFFSTKARLEDHVRFHHLGHVRPRLSRPQTENPMALIDELSGVTNQLRQTLFCGHCNEAFSRSHDLQLHITKMHQHAPDNSDTSKPFDDAAPYLHSADLDMQAHIPSGADPVQNHWADDTTHDMFTSQLACIGLQDPWLQAEADISLLTRDPPYSLDVNIDPCLAGLGGV